MRILVLSDSHGRPDLLRRALEKEPTARTVFFLGDGLRDLEEIEPDFPDRRFYAVAGNCDWDCLGYPPLIETTVGGKRVVAAHGHRYDVRSGIDRLAAYARSRKADLALFGHTHAPLHVYEDGLYVLNGGSIGYGGTYGIADITDTGIFIDVREV